MSGRMGWQLDAAGIPDEGSRHTTGHYNVRSMPGQPDLWKAQTPLGCRGHMVLASDALPGARYSAAGGVAGSTVSSGGNE